MTGVQIMQAIIEILVGGISGVATGIGQGLSTLAQSVFLQTTGEGASATTSLSVFGVLVVVFAGISLAIGLSRWVVNFVASLGARNR
ncbi:MAG: hypothetical protein SOY02_06610 [Candidatus Onthovivens sp.]|nr:hypothetical protein [Candidatus Onthovivens sp.]